jgi:predicted AlkP superfamily pyrophosphatase or phosphodiesterase
MATDQAMHDIATAEAALLDPAVAHMVEVVLRRSPEADDTYEAASVEGRVRFRRRNEGTGWAFDVTAVEGVNPLADQATDRFTGLPDELANRYPTRRQNSYPHAFDQVAQLFDSPEAPELVSIHTSAHNWEDQGGERGEHGSISVIQARAPFILAGKGVRQQGLVPRSCRLVDIAPTVLALMGAEPGEGMACNGTTRPDAYLRRQDGEVIDDLFATDVAVDRPKHVVGFLLDGANANVLYDMAARGEAPNVARLLDMGVGFAHGAMSSLPTITLANHTSILTGTYPGHHGILNNAWWDRANQEQVITNSPAHWLTAMERLDPGVETMYQAVKRHRPGAVAVSINEPCDTGADHSIFDLMRRGEPLDMPPPVEELPHVTERFVRPVKEYQWSTMVDHVATEQAMAIWGGRYRDTDWPAPDFMWVNFSLTDAAFHAGGPYSEVAAASVHDTDARLGEVLRAVEEAGVFDDTAFFVTADHGMEDSNPECTGNWADALDASGVTYRDEGYSFIYVNP